MKNCYDCLTSQQLLDDIFNDVKETEKWNNTPKKTQKAIINDAKKSINNFMFTGGKVWKANN